MTDPSDNKLAKRAGAGDREAFAELVERHYDRIFRLAVRVLGDGHAAADIAQEVCVSLPSKLASFRGSSRFTTWLYRVVVNAARDSMRRAATRQRLEREYSELNAFQQSTMADQRGEVLWLRLALRKLPEDLRVTVVLVVGEGLPHGEAAQALGVAESTVSWRMSQARKRLRVIAREEEMVQ